MTSGAKAIIYLLIAALLGLAGVAGWQYNRANKAEEELGLDAGRVLKAIFVQARDLRVARLTGVAVARSDNDGTVFHSEQRTVAPFAVSYFVDLRKVRQGDYEWNPKRRLMTITIPDVTVETPAVDMARAQAKVKGWWVSREAALQLARKASEVLATTAAVRAKSEENMSKARTSARLQVRDIIRQPLAAADFGDVEVEVRFPWEGRRSTEQWDRSRRPEEVLRDNP